MTTIWIDTVTAKLRQALAHAAAGEPFDWDKLGPNPWPTLIPDTLELATNRPFTWPGPRYPGWPEPPGADASFAEIKHYACVQVMAEAYLLADVESELPDWARLTSTRAWTLAESVYNTVYSPFPVGQWDPYAWQPYQLPALRQALEWEDDVFTYSLPNARTLQEMAQTTPYTRRQWIDAWTKSFKYRRAMESGRLPVLAEWLDPMRRILPGQTLDRAAQALNMIQGFSYLGDVLLDAAKSITLLAAVFKPRCPHGPTPCSCRPAPNPAGRDYRRRTKHRRRRQR